MVGGPLWSPEFVTRRLLEHWVRPRRGEAPLQFPRELFEFKSGIRLRGAVLQRAADVDKCKGELEDDEGVGVVVPAPENADAVIKKVRLKLADIEKGLPEGVKFKVAYDRSELIEAAIGSVKKTIIEEMAVVSLI